MGDRFIAQFAARHPKLSVILELTNRVCETPIAAHFGAEWPDWSNWVLFPFADNRPGHLGKIE